MVRAMRREYGACSKHLLRSASASVARCPRLCAKHARTAPLHTVSVVEHPRSVPNTRWAMPRGHWWTTCLRAAAHTFKRGSTVLIRATGDGVETDFRATASERVGELTFQFLAGDFFQNNPFILPEFTGYVAGQAAAGGARCLVDA